MTCTQILHGTTHGLIVLGYGLVWGLGLGLAAGLILFGVLWFWVERQMREDDRRHELETSGIDPEHIQQIAVFNNTKQDELHVASVEEKWKDRSRIIEELAFQYMTDVPYLLRIAQDFLKQQDPAFEPFPKNSGDPERTYTEKRCRNRKCVRCYPRKS